MNKVNKFPGALLCLVIVLVFFTACDTGTNGDKNPLGRTSLPAETEWGCVGLTSSTLDLPGLTVDYVFVTPETTASSYAKVKIGWTGASLEDFNTLAQECYTEIPANLNWFGLVSTPENCKDDYQDCLSFTAYYVTGNTAYEVSVFYYYTDAYFQIPKNTMVLLIEEIPYYILLI
ncbi:hypothetical protein K7I13_11890 [Brucepastera parasyntrophica]|uniref:hypothetical protein n=1 Tax=Brucepastera parasyntrophica TaxID=2880008 RepID=UPI00210D516B|nr:hypothetical protein [Brucepastera parasyntrophica]ULQ59189.1 hypothetical protein K7I13_11890 [Brucepastera parasyntrophica]